MSTPTSVFPTVSSLGATSGDGVLRRVQGLVVSICVLGAANGTTASAPVMALPELLSSAQTNSGLTLELPAPAKAAAIAELRRRSGLTWEDLAELFGVSRRSVHFWASGKPLNASHEEALNQLLHVVRYIDRGAGAATRSALASLGADGVSPLELLAEGRYGEVMRRLGRGSDAGAVVRPPRRSDRHPLWAPPAPDRLVGAVHDTAHENVGRARAGRSVKTRKAP